MAFLTSVRNLSLLDTNLLLSESLTMAWATSNLTVTPGAGTAMLEDDDATSLFKAVASGSGATIEVEFRVGATPTAQNVSAFGLCNHNLRTAGLQYLYLDYWNGSTWVNVDTPGTDPYTMPSGYTDRDVILLFDTVNTTKMRMRFLGQPALAFYIGYIYWGMHYQFTRNPASFVQTRTPATRYMVSAGGMSHAIKGMRYRPGTLEMTFVRAKAVDLIHIQQLGLTDNIIGVLPPEYSPKPELAPRANDNFFGRFEEITMDPQTPSNVASSSEVYNVEISMKGAL